MSFPQLLSILLNIAYNNFEYMMASKTKQRLFLNRQKKRAVPLEIVHPMHSELKGVAFRSPFLDKQNNNSNQNNSSIVRKNSLSKCELVQEQKPAILRSRSISCMGDNGKLRIRSLAAANKDQICKSRKSSTLKDDGSWLHRLSLQFSGNLVEKGEEMSKNGCYHLPSSMVLASFLEFAKRLMEEHTKHQKVYPISKNYLTAVSPPQSSVQLISGHSFKIEQQYNNKIEIQKTKILSLASEKIRFHVKYQEVVGSRETFWRLIPRVSSKSATEGQLMFMIEKLHYLKHEINLKEKALRTISSEADKQQMKYQMQKSTNLSLQKRIEEHRSCLRSMEKESRDMREFLNAQPNRILQLEAEGYKEQEQQLFDFACGLQNNVPLQVSTWVGESTLVPRESIQLTLKSFPNKSPDVKTGLYSLSFSQIEAFKKSLKASHDLIVGKLQGFLDSKCDKIRQFIKTMRRLASYTIGKREYLDEVNKKMAIASSLGEMAISRLNEQLQILIDKAQKSSILKQKDDKIETPIELQLVLPSPEELLEELRSLCMRMKQIYNEAQVFY